MRRQCLLIALSIAATIAASGLSIAAECAPGQSADQTGAWPRLVGIAKRDIEEYAVAHNPRAVFILAEAAVYYQYGGPHVGQYIVQLVVDTPYGTALARLLPRFDFCADAAMHAEADSGLFRVVLAKLNGREF